MKKRLKAFGSNGDCLLLYSTGLSFSKFVFPKENINLFRPLCQTLVATMFLKTDFKAVSPKVQTSAENGIEQISEMEVKVTGLAKCV